MFLNFMLARLLSLRQVVLLCDNLIAYLFYRGKVYFRSAEISLGSLPTKDPGYCPVWGLIDVEYTKEEPPSSITNNLRVWPSRFLFQTPCDGVRGVSRPVPFCWGCLYGIRRNW